MFKDYYHYSVGNRKTLDKLEAIIWASEKNEWIRFHIPEWLQNLPTHIEPEESLKELCIKRAHKLRQEHTYLRLWYSGGCDSTYVLNTFVDNKIHIDEIMCMKSGLPKADWEIDQVAVPYLEKLKNKLHHTKITVKQPTLGDYKDWYNNPYWFENYQKIGRLSKLFMGIRLNEKLESINVHDNNSDTANIVGLDKPFVHFVNGEWYTFFLDVNVDFQLGEQGNSYHAFFSDDPLIFIKQCHLLKRGIIENIPDTNEYNRVCNWDKKYQKIWNSSIERVHNNQTFILKDYETIENFQGLNSKESIAQKFISENHPDLYKKFILGLNNLNDIDSKWFNDGSARKGTLGIFADFKSIDTNSTKTVDELFPNGYKV